MTRRRSIIAGVGRFDPGPEHDVVGVSRALDVGRSDHAGRRSISSPRRAVCAQDARPAFEPRTIASAGGDVAEFLRDSGCPSPVASPIVVDGQLWGAMLWSTQERTSRPTPRSGSRQFTELVATAIANAESREELGALADEQAALRRVATLVAEDVAAGSVFRAVGEQVGHLLEADLTSEPSQTTARRP